MKFSKRESRTHPFAFDLIARLFAGWPRKRLEKEKAKEGSGINFCWKPKKKGIALLCFKRFSVLRIASTFGVYVATRYY